MERSSGALAASAAITGVLGLAYWAGIARAYPAGEVGAAAATITTATMLSAFGNLSLGAFYERFLPVAGHRSTRLLAFGYGTGVALGVALGMLFLLSDSAGAIFAGTLERCTFPLIVAVLAVFALQDHTAIGLQRAEWAAGKNVAHAVVKLGAVLALGFTASRFAIVWTWVAPAALGAAVLGALIVRTVRSPAIALAPSGLPQRREMAGYLGSSYGIYVVSAVVPLALPLLVVGRLGVDANAYFSIAWSLVAAVLVLLTMLMGPYVAAAAAAPAAAYALTKRFGRLLLVAGTGGVLLFAVLGPWLLELVGERYAQEGTPLLRVAALALPLALVGVMYSAVSRVRRRLRLAIFVQLLNSALTLVLAVWLIDRQGLPGVGWAFVVAESVSALVLAVPLLRVLRWVRTEAAAAPTQLVFAESDA